MTAFAAPARPIEPVRPFEPTAHPAARRWPRLIPAPRREPHYDDEIEAEQYRVGPYDQVLPFPDFGLATPSALRLQDPLDPFGHRPTGRADLPEAGPWAKALLTAVLETLAGRRGVSQLVRHTTPGVLAGIRRDIGRMQRLAAPGAAAAVRSVHVCEPADGIAEISATVEARGRVRAVALRIEGVDGSWRCVRLQIG